MRKEDFVHEIAKKEYEFFVVNTCAAGIQQKDGKYITKYVPLSPFVIENMLLQHESMGCYQQGYKTNKIKWVCLDFDCKNKDNPDVEKLYNQYVVPFIKLLEELQVSYLTEFSGRRGIHVWIVFKELFSKEIGFKILNELLKRCAVLSSINECGEWGIDKFPATDSAKNNVVGKQVKFPLSCHKSGGKSYFFENEFQYERDIESEKFYETQFDILNKFHPNDLEIVLGKLNLKDIDVEYKITKYKKYILLGSIEVTIDEIINVLSETKVYKAIFDRMKLGVAESYDWTVLMGTLILCDTNAQILKELFRRFPNYDEEKTISNIEKLGNKYYPATFEYLYHIYDMILEEEIDKTETGLHYLFRRLGVEQHLLQQYEKVNEKVNISDIAITVQKEKKYIKDNDEVPDVTILNEMSNLKAYDLRFYDETIQKIKEGYEINFSPTGYRIYERIESSEKSRLLVSLSARDRVITTHLALVLCEKLRYTWKSYSYHVSFISQNHIFYYWYSSWGRFIDKLRVFLEIPFMERYEVFYLDLKGFYDHIDFLTVYRTFEESLEEESKRIFLKLIEYNDLLMKSLHEGNRIGVPQGPAYARIIAEMYLDRVLEKTTEKYDQTGFYMYRYVDDIVFFCKPDFQGKTLYEDLKNMLLTYGLPINSEKSRYFGEIALLTEEDKMFLLHADRFNYELQENEFTGMLLERERKKNLRKYLMSHSFDIGSLGYIFAQNTITEAQSWCVDKYRKDIFKSREGRGSNFRKFYSFLFRNEGYMEEILEKKELFAIPEDSINFSNFIHTLYLTVQNKGISHDLFFRIKNEYLMRLDNAKINDIDYTVINALIMIEPEVLNETN